ncbi:anaphase-promoting complex subunit 1 [Strongylocentrotus purpuratus]|uniref:Anaphase-promoting complex subunit 1 N-terminal domain-containing protein n=1 Tax=Strongylocentrotus purpuratus TaxID=7668 RepID=A0A7M7T535_STRPU|nr:anaphase-promoting complex subunit 1 [Strongylocentrotus purpuratus]
MSAPPLKKLELSISNSCETVELEGKLEDEVMIAASEPRAYVPFGRSISSHHPGQDSLPQQKDIVSDHDVPLAAFKDVSIREGPEKEFWQIRECADAEDCDEELYFKDRVVVWSKGCGYSTSSVKKTFTLQESVQQVEWSRFRMQRLEPTDVGKSTLGENEQEEDVLGISITHPTSITVFTEAGEKFVASLPFQVSRTWIVDGGMLLEQAVSQTELSSVYSKREKEKLPTLFSLLHPLDEPTPVLCRNGKK